MKTKAAAMKRAGEAVEEDEIHKRLKVEKPSKKDKKAKKQKKEKKEKKAKKAKKETSKAEQKEEVPDPNAFLGVDTDSDDDEAPVIIESEEANLAAKQKNAALYEALEAAKTLVSGDEDDDEEEEDEEEAGVPATNEPSAVPEVDRTVYVEGIPYEASEASIREFFSSAGKIQELRLPRYQDTGRLRGYAHVVFPTKKAARKALELDGKFLGKRFLSVVQAKPAGEGENFGPSKNRRPKGCTTLFVKNLPYDIDEQVVRSAFKKFGEIKDIRLTRWQHTGALKGVGYVQFTHGPSVDAAVKEAGSLQIGGRTLKLDYEMGTPRSSFRTADGRLWTKENKDLAAKAMNRGGFGGRGRGGFDSRGGRGRGRGGRGAYY